MADFLEKWAKPQSSNIMFTAFKVTIRMHYNCKAVNKYKANSYLCVIIKNLVCQETEKKTSGSQ